MEIRERELWLDSLKGFAIILVVFGHCIDGVYRMNLFTNYQSILEISHSVIYFFHMPLFFAISGYVFKKCLDSKTNISQYSLNLLVLYFVFASIQVAIQIIMGKSLNHTYSVNDLLMLPIVTIPPYWYVYVLAIYYIIWHGTEKRIGYKAVLFLSLLMHTFSILITSNNFEIHRVLYFSCFFIIGYKIDKSAFLEYIIPISIIIGIILKLLGRTMLSFPKLSDVLYTSFNMTIVFSIIFSFCFAFKRICLLNNRFLILCGQASLYIYLLHCYLTAGSRIFLSKMKCDNFYIYIVVGTFFGVAIPLLLYVNRNKCSILKYLFDPIKTLTTRKE